MCTFRLVCARLLVCVCVCVCERERERVCVCECVSGGAVLFKELPISCAIYHAPRIHACTHAHTALYIGVPSLLWYLCA